MPSPCPANEPSTSRTTLASTLTNSSAEAQGVTSSCVPDTLRHSQVFHGSAHLYQTAAGNSPFLSSDQADVACAQKPARLAAELTLNQPLFKDQQATGSWSPLQMFRPGTSAGLEKEPSKVLDAKQTTETNRVTEKQTLNPASLYSSPAVAQSQIWKQETCGLHQLENCAHSTWKQRLENDWLQAEQIQLQNKAGCYHPLSNTTPLHTFDPAQWVGIVNANEHLLREKEILIDRQRQHIAQLEQKVRESELHVRTAFFGHPASYGDMYLLRMQELQRENIFLRAQFTEKTESLCKEKIELEKKLAASETGIKQFQEAHKETMQKHTVELKKQEERVKARDKHIEQLKKKCQKESEQNREKQQRIETLERYVADLPMLEDHQKQNQQLKESQQATAALQETVTALEKKLGEVRANCKEKELQLEMQKHKEMELLSTVHSLQDKMQRGKTPAAESFAQEIEREKREKDSLQKERDLLRKIVDNQKKKIDQLSSQVKDMEQQLAQEEGTGQALKAEALRKENALQQLRVAVKEMSAQNQELMEKNLTLQEHLRQIEPDHLLSDETTHLTQELHRELASCLQDLQSVYSVVTQRAQGKDPNLSLLLGIHTVYCSVKEEEDLLKPDMLAKKLEDVKELHKDIEDLRTAISDRYAQDMGDNCITQ
ncbi:centrosomal protein of 85 kDa isoform X2 [Sceloporus undulatus]|nr:centrosomal protein of 85 kDa isoform X2 [Sceloporus undulatus]XP_042296702.1 centrosomal protein of 85 kDa isoform X2 [Sceloporus undulatus]XP_042296703.1 centrosomal protein of 85 kDa isoform X2 [Sceloporus undulatus]